jgi:2-haloacid dehalogenase
MRSRSREALAVRTSKGRATEVSLSTRPPTALVFDVYGTIFDPSRVARALSGIVAEPRRFTAMWQRKQLEYAWLATAADRYEPFAEITRRALRFTAAVHETEIPEKLQRELVESWSSLDAHREATDAIGRLARVFPLVALTNGAEDQARRLLERADLLRSFRHVVSAEHAGAFKPAPRVYELALAVLGLPREEILYVSAHGWDAAGAQLFGFRVCRVDRKSEPDEAIAPRPELVVKSLVALADVLSGQRVAAEKP